MATTDLERLVVQLSADVTKYQNAMNRAQGITNRTARQIEGRFQRMNRLASSSLGTFGRGLAGGIVAGFSIQQAGQLVDAATRITNSLKVAGLEGAELERVYQRLFKVAKQTATPFEELVGVYGKVIQASKDLGASSKDADDFVGTLAKALQVSGKSAASSAGALLQLGQALGGTMIQSQEYNSLLDGAYPLLQAVAAGLKEAGGSVSTLTRLVKDGLVPTKAFFQAGIAGAPILEEKLAGSALTISQRMENLRTSMVNAAYEFENGTSAADAFGDQIDRLGAFIDSVNFGKLIDEIRSVGTEFGLVVETVREFLDLVGRLSGGNLLAGIGRATGLDRVGEMLTGGQGRADFFEGGLTVTSQKVVRDRINSAFQGVGEAVTEAGQLTEQAIIQSAERMGNDVATTGKTGRLKELQDAVVASQVSLEDFPVAADKAKKALSKVGEQVNSSLIDTAQRFEGFSENRSGDRAALTDFFKAANVNVDPKMTAWCAAFVNAVLATNGLPSSGSLMARSFLDYGTPTQDPKPGDLVILKRGSGNVQGHVGFFMGDAANGGVRVLGGNQGDEVSTKTFAREDVLGFRQVDIEAQNAGLARSVELRQKQLEIVAQLQEAGQTETARIQLETALVGASNAERERQMFIFERINELQAQNIPITDALRASVEAEAQARFGAVASYDATIAAQEAAAESAERLRQKQEELQYAQQEIAGAFQGALKGLITDLAHGKDATEALLDAVSRLADRLLDIALDMLFQNLFSGLGGALGGGGLLAGLFHSGGKAGAAVAARTVSPLMFAGAQRYHSGGLAGLKPGEVPAILQRGELVLPRSQVRSMARSSQGPQNVDARTTVVNTFDAGSFLSEALSRPEGVKVVLNAVRAQPGAFRAAINA